MVLSRFDIDYWSSQQLYDKHFDWLLFITYWRREVWMTSPLQQFPSSYMEQLDSTLSCVFSGRHIRWCHPVFISDSTSCATLSFLPCIFWRRLRKKPYNYHQSMFILPYSKRSSHSNRAKYSSGVAKKRVWLGSGREKKKLITQHDPHLPGFFTLQLLSRCWIWSCVLAIERPEQPMLILPHSHAPSHCLQFVPRKQFLSQEAAK